MFVRRLCAFAALATGVWGQVRIMPLGDSITGSPGCWRALLYNSLISSGYTNIDMVGTLPAQGCGVTYDGDNEGHGGFLGVNIASQNQLVGWLASTKPDVVMMHLGTNDVWNNLSPATITAAFSTLVDQMRASNAKMKILVAQIIPMNPSNCADCNSRAQALNAAIPAWASSKNSTNSPIWVVDQYTGFNTTTNTGDGVHPIDSGNVKIAAKWLAPLQNAIKAVSGGGSTTTSATTTTRPGTTTVPPTLPTTTPLAGAYGQCGGTGWTGPTACVSGYTCKISSEWYSQCVPA